jgi:hypothetical protein
MTAPTRSFTEIAKVGQESVAAAVRLWADFAQASVKVITTGQSELLDGRRAADFVFGVANQMLAGQRALLSAMTTATAGGRSAVGELSKLAKVSNGAVVETTAKAVGKTTEAAVEAEKAVAETASEAVAKNAETVETEKAVVETASETAAEAGKATEKAAESAAETEKVVAEKAAETVEVIAETAPKTAVETAEGPYGPGSHGPLPDRSKVPAGFAIKGNDGSKLYHMPGSPFYKRTNAEVWFATAEAAEAAGFQRPASQR